MVDWICGNLNALGRIVFKPQIGILSSKLFFCFGCSICNFLFVQSFVVRPQRAGLGWSRGAALSVKVSVVFDRLLAQITHLGTTARLWTSHLVATLLLEVFGVALPALPYHCLTQLLLNLLPGLLFILLLHFITAQRDMVGLLAQSAALASTLWIPEAKKLVEVGRPNIQIQMH